MNHLSGCWVLLLLVMAELLAHFEQVLVLLVQVGVLLLAARRLDLQIGLLLLERRLKGDEVTTWL